MSKDAIFVYDAVHDHYLAANKEALGISSILSKIRLKHSDMVIVRSKGYTPRLTNGEEIGKVRITT